MFKILNNLCNLKLAKNNLKSYITYTIPVRQQHEDAVNKSNFDMANPFEKEKRKCILCRLNIVPDYKNVQLLSQFQSSYTGRIYGRHITGLCIRKQQEVEKEIQKAQNAGLMGYYNKNVSFVKDPKLFDPDHPFRPHRF